MEHRKFGYCRVSSVAQHEDRQLIAMMELGIPEKNIFLKENRLCQTNVYLRLPHISTCTSFSTALHVYSYQITVKLAIRLSTIIYIILQFPPLICFDFPSFLLRFIEVFVLHLLRHFNQPKPVKHPINICHSTDVTKCLGAFDNFTNLMNIPKSKHY